jgi:hypothetical protein
MRSSSRNSAGSQRPVVVRSLRPDKARVPSSHRDMRGCSRPACCQVPLHYRTKLVDMIKASLMLLVVSGAMPVRAQLSGGPLKSVQSFAADTGLENGFGVANYNVCQYLEFWWDNQISELVPAPSEGPGCADAQSAESSRAEQKACTSVVLPPSQPSAPALQKSIPKKPQPQSKPMNTRISMARLLQEQIGTRF